jgi:hypothetical protein
VATTPEASIPRLWQFYFNARAGSIKRSLYAGQKCVYRLSPRIFSPHFANPWVAEKGGRKVGAGQEIGAETQGS